MVMNKKKQSERIANIAFTALNQPSDIRHKNKVTGIKINVCLIIDCFALTIYDMTILF